MKKVTYLLIAGAVFGVLLPAAMALAQVSARKVLSPWDGEWQGVFRIFNNQGKLLDSLQVHQKYWWKDRVQKGVITDTYSDGRVEISHAENFVRNDTLFCVVKKANGETTIHTGLFDAGRLTWSRRLPERHLQESFKEYVARTPRGLIYFIDGVGIYGTGKDQIVLLFEGRYRNISE